MDLYNNLNYIKVKYSVVGRIMIPKDLHILTPGTWACVILHGKRDFANANVN